MDIAMVERLYAALLPAHEEAIRVAARSPRRADTTKDHSPGLVVFVSQELGVPLPQPEYLDALKNAAPIPEEIPADEEFQEGAAVQVLVNRYERDPAQDSFASNTTGASPAASRSDTYMDQRPTG
jgi:hypothetical protein